jgi:hypothetical protein
MPGPLRGDASRPIAKIQDDLGRFRVYTDRIDERFGRINPLRMTQEDLRGYANRLRFFKSRSEEVCGVFT